MGNVGLTHASFLQELNYWKADLMDYAGFWYRVEMSFQLAGFSMAQVKLIDDQNSVPRTEVLNLSFTNELDGGQGFDKIEAGI